MTSHVYTVQLHDPLQEVFNLVRKHHIRHVPVMEGKKLVGIISRTDLNRLAFSNLYSSEEDADMAIFEMLSIKNVMTSHPRVVKDTDTVHDVAEIFSTEEFHALPVVKASQETTLAGIVTTTDVIRYLLNQYK